MPLHRSTPIGVVGTREGCPYIAWDTIDLKAPTIAANVGAGLAPALFLTHAAALSACGGAREAAEVLERGRKRLDELAALITDAEMRRQFLEDVQSHRELRQAA